MRYDVDEINQIRCDVDFYVMEEPGLFVVKAECESADELGSIKFKLNTYKIFVDSTNSEIGFFVKWHWYDENSACVLQVNEENEDPGVIRQMALEGIFFSTRMPNLEILFKRDVLCQHCNAGIIAVASTS